jgi:hypothetical protein
MSIKKWFEYIFCCACCFKPKTILDLNEYNVMDDNEVTVSFNSTPPKGSVDRDKGYSLSDEITYNDIYR